MYNTVSNNLSVWTQSQIPLEPFELHFVKTKHQVFVWGLLRVYLLILREELNLCESMR